MNCFWFSLKYLAKVYLQIMELPAEATTIVEAFSCARYAKEFFYRMCQVLMLFNANVPHINIALSTAFGSMYLGIW